MIKKFLKIFVSILSLMAILFAMPQSISAGGDDFSETWYGYAQGGRPDYNSSAQYAQSSADKFGNGINAYRWYYSAKTTRYGSTRDASFPSKNTAGGVVLNSWNTNGKTWHITGYYSDVDVCTSSWTNYWQPTVVLRCNGSNIYTLQTNSSNVEQNGSGSNLNLTCNGTVDWYSYGDTGSGRTKTYIGGGNGFDYYYEETTSGKISGWAYYTSQLSGFSSIDGVYASGIVRPTLAVNASSFRKFSPYSQTIMSGNYWNSASTAILPLQTNIYYHSNGADSGSASSSGSNQTMPSFSWSKTGYSMAASLYFDSASTQEAVNLYSQNSITATNLQTRLSSLFSYNNIYNNLTLQGSAGSYYLQGGDTHLYAKWIPCNFNIVLSVKDNNDPNLSKLGSDLSVSYNGIQTGSFNFGSTQYDSNASSLNFTTINTNSDKYEFLGWYDKNGNQVVNAEGKLLASSSMVSNGKIAPTVYEGTISRQVNSNSTGDTKTINLYGRWRLRDTTPPEISSNDLDAMMTTCTNGGWFNKSNSYDKKYLTITDKGTDGGAPTGVVKVELYDIYSKSNYAGNPNTTNYTKSLVKTLYSGTAKESVQVYLTVEEIKNLNSTINESLRNNSSLYNYFQNKFFIRAYDANGNMVETPYDIPCIDTDNPTIENANNYAGRTEGLDSYNQEYIINCANGNSYNFSISAYNSNTYYNGVGNFNIAILSGDLYSSGYFASGIDEDKTYIKVQYYNSTTNKWVDAGESYYKKGSTTKPNTNLFNFGATFETITPQSTEGYSAAYNGSNYFSTGNYINIFIHLVDKAGNITESGKLITSENYSTKTWNEDSSSGYCKVVSNISLYNGNNALIDFTSVFRKYDDLNQDANALVAYLKNCYAWFQSNSGPGHNQVSETTIKAYEYIQKLVSNGLSVDEAVERFKTQYRYDYWKANQA